MPSERSYRRLARCRSTRPATVTRAASLPMSPSTVQRDRRLTRDAGKRANFLVVLGGAPGAAAKLTRFVLPRVEPYGLPAGVRFGQRAAARVRPCRHVSGIGPLASAGSCFRAANCRCDGPFSRFPASPATPELPVQQTRSHSGNAPLSMFRAVPSASAGTEGTRTRATRCPESRPYVGCLDGWALGARVCRARGCGGRGGAGATPRPGPESVYSTPLSTTRRRPRQRPSPRERPGGAGVDEDVLPG
ncbi:hornerin-like [Iris pallida]|uniref:Hornerin-like n=1 Tax=Iris pallida TaxID=29817 RepID=A0AAX6FMS8_IRIPA|nr:hornerin-like [Iris pallida]